jgi:hypothetical protein
MEPYRPSLQRRLASVWEFLSKLLDTLRPRAQTGHGTDKIRLCVSGLVSTFLVFSIVNDGNGQFCSLAERTRRKKRN